MYRRKDREASLIEPKSQVKKCSAHAEILQQNDERTVYRLRETDGEVRITAYPVFPGIELAYHDVHAPSYRLAEPGAAGLIEIQHCREGRAEYCCGGEHYFLAPGDLSVVRRAAIEGEVEFPTGHYHGITVTLDPALAPDCLVLHFAGCRRPPQRAGGEVLRRLGVLCLAFVGARGAHLL